MLSAEVVEDSEEMILMIKKGKRMQEKKLIDNFWLGPELVNNISETPLNFKFHTEIKDFTELHSKEIV